MNHHLIISSSSIKKKDDSDEENKDKKKEKKDKKSKDKKKEKKSKDKKKEKKDKDEADDASADGAEPATENLDDANAMALAVEATKKFLEENTDATPSAIAEKITNEQMASGLKSQDKIHIFIRAAFTPDFFKHKQVETHAETIGKITQGKNVMERNLISACESLCADKPKCFAVLIKQLFDEDVLEEDAILEWAGEGRTDYTPDSVNEDQRCNMRAEAEPVVNWLMEDDSDSDSD